LTEIKFKLRDLYAKKGQTQKTISEETGIRESTLSGYANNFRSSIDIKILAKLIDYFELDSLDDLIEIVRNDSDNK
jgi:transcriptional regulator with XRE-family HTH domain